MVSLLFEKISASSGSPNRTFQPLDSNLPVSKVQLFGIQIVDGVASIGYWVAPWGRKSGAASTALRIIPTLARRIGKAQTLHATIAETNTASRRTAERAGFTLIGNSADYCPDGSASATGLLYQMTGPVA